MYVPDHFRMGDEKEIVKFIRKFSLGILFSSAGGLLQASSLPLLVDDGCTVLKGHMAVENKQWDNLDGNEVLVVFQGPGHYISPTWYGTKGDLVPTWNYVSVQVHGVIEFLKSEEQKMAILDELVEHYEQMARKNWSVDWGRKSYMTMAGEIVAFRIVVTKAEGKLKMSQNHPVSSMRNVAETLSLLGDGGAGEVSEMMYEEAMKKEAGINRHRNEK